MDWSQTSYVLSVSMIGGFVSLCLKWLFDILILTRTTRNQKDIFIHQRQFEQEFDAYVEIWRYLPDFNDCRWADADLATSDLIEKQGEIFRETAEALNLAIRSNEPFMCEPVMNAIRAMLRYDQQYSSGKRKLDRHTSKPNYDPDKAVCLDEECTEALTGIQNSINDIKDAIRARVWNKR